MTKKKRFQIGLREVFLWAVVVAVWSSLLGFWLGESVSLIVELSLWAAVVGIIRRTVGLKWAALTAVLMGPCLVLIEYLVLGYPTSVDSYLAILLCVFTCLVFVFVEAAYHVVKLLDRLMESKEDEGSGHA